MISEAKRKLRIRLFPMSGDIIMMIDDDTLKQLLRIDDELMRLCKWLNEKRDMKM
jgi:hypothetical protein